MVKLPIVTIAPMALLLLCSGCATMFGRGTQELDLVSEPTGATVFIDGADVGTTPFILRRSALKAIETSVELQLKGFAPCSLVVRAEPRGGVLFADAMLLGIPYLFDAKRPELHQFPVPEMRVNLHKVYPADLQRLELPVDVMENAIPADVDLGRVNGRRLTAESRELADLRYPDGSGSSILRGLKDSWADAWKVRLATAKGEAEAQRAKVVLRPRALAADLQLTERDDRSNGMARLVMDWRFFSTVRTDSMLFSVKTNTQYQAVNERTGEVLGLALQEAARQLLDTDSLQERIRSNYGLALQLSKGERVLLHTPEPLAFSDPQGMIPAVVKGVVTLEMKDGHGSGFLVTSDGYIMTNAHVVGTQATTKVRFQQGFSLEGQVVKVNRDFDLALVKVPGDDMPALTMGDDHGLQLGAELFAIGTPLDNQLGQTVSRGILSGNRVLNERRYLQTDVSINPGNSGGPLIDTGGRVVGVASRKVSAEGVEGIGFAVPISSALEMLNIEFIP